MSALPLTLGVLLLAMLACFGRAGMARLARLQLRGGGLAVLAVAAQAVGLLTQQRLAWLIVAVALLAAFCWSNRRMAGLALIACGIALNMLVMIANGGVMPINAASVARLGIHDLQDPDLPLQKSRLLDDDAARLAWLGDRLHLPGPLAPLAAWSIGDIVLIAGVSTLLWRTMKGTAFDLPIPS